MEKGLLTVSFVGGQQWQSQNILSINESSSVLALEDNKTILLKMPTDDTCVQTHNWVILVNFLAIKLLTSGIPIIFYLFICPDIFFMYICSDFLHAASFISLSIFKIIILGPFVYSSLCLSWEQSLQLLLLDGSYSPVSLYILLFIIYDDETGYLNQAI